MSDAAATRQAYRSSPRRYAFLAAALAIAVLPMVLTGNYWQTNLTVCAINVLLALGLDFILGYAGQLNLGQSAFYGLGAYVSTLLITKLGVPFWGAFAAGVAFAGLAGMILALFAVRLRGHYLAIASLGFAVIIHQILLNWISLTQGPLGIYAIPPPPGIAIPGLPAISFRNPVALFYLVAAFALLVYFLLDPDQAAAMNWRGGELRATMIAIIDFENPTILKELLDSNAHGVLVRPIRPGGVLSTLVLASSHRNYEARLLGKVAKLEETLKARREIEKATRIIMKLRGLSEGEAYEFIRRQATAKRISTGAIATSIINAQTILSELDGGGKG